MRIFEFRVSRGNDLYFTWWKLSRCHFHSREQLVRHMEKEGAEILLIIKASEFNVDEEGYIDIFNSYKKQTN